MSEHPLLSVTVTVYKPGGKLFNALVISPLLHKKEYCPDPFETELIAAFPSVPPTHVVEVVEVLSIINKEQFTKLKDEVVGVSRTLKIFPLLNVRSARRHTS